MTALDQKLTFMRSILAAEQLGALRLRGVDWFSWATDGASNVVLLAAETGVAEVLVTPDESWILTDTIEAERLETEELPTAFRVHAVPWQHPEQQERWLQARVQGPIASDRPSDAEVALPAALVAAKRRLYPVEIERYRRAGAAAAAAVTETLVAARSAWTEQELAGAAAAALWARGIEPALVLAGSEARLVRYGHTPPTTTGLGGRAMLVVCGRWRGLYVNMTRFVHFRPLSADEQHIFDTVAQVEQAAWAASRPGATLADVLAAITRAYADHGHAGAEQRLHQGGSTGYLSREVVARPDVQAQIAANMALAWNPSLPGFKLEDTILVTDQGVEILTVDPVWPTVAVNGYLRPLSLER